LVWRMLELKRRWSGAYVPLAVSCAPIMHCHRVDASRFTAAGTGSPRRARPSPGGSTPHEASEQQRLRRDPQMGTRDPDSRVRLDLEWSTARGAHLGGKTFRDATTNPIYATCSSNGKSMMRSRGSQAQVDRLAPSRPEPASCSCNTWHISGWWSHQIFFPSRRAVGVIERGDRTYFFRVDERNPFPSSLLKRELERARGIRRG
jgi:hypothetical protein